MMPNMGGTLDSTVEAAINKLPLEFQILLDLTFWGELSEYEIEEELELSAEEVVYLRDEALRALYMG